MPEINYQQFSIGTDPEVFVWNKRTKRYVPAHTVGAGTKERPVPLPGARWPVPMMQIDGMALEFNTAPSFFNMDVREWIKSAIDDLKRYISRKNEDLTLKFQPTAHFDEEVWHDTPDEHKILGCNPDYNAWAMRMNDPPNPDGKLYRTGAGHIHIGWTNNQDVQDDDFCLIGATLAKELDATLGVASVLFDDDQERRTLYGKAGAFRPKPYGIEYRTLSNKWVGSAGLRTYVLARTGDALRNMMARRLIQHEQTQDIINDGKKDDALHWLRQHNITVPPSHRGQF